MVAGGAGKPAPPVRHYLCGRPFLHVCSTVETAWVFSVVGLTVSR